MDTLMLRHLIYASIINEGWLKNQRDHEKAADRVIDILQRGNYLTTPEPREPATQPAGAMTKEWCAAYPASAAYIINNLAARLDAIAIQPTPEQAESKSL
jgi:hypothetical protein